MQWKMNFTLFVIVIAVVSLFHSLTEGKRHKKDPDIGKKTPDFIKSNGYPLETHKITTEDGYIVTYFRIPHGKSKPKSSDTNTKGKPVIMLQHGLLASSAAFFIQPASTALPFILANSGYDVWLGNARGTTYSRGHTNKTYNSKKDINIYWSYSFEHIAKYDIPAAIDYILKLTGQKKLIYLGHSQGTTQFFAMLSLRPEYNEKIQVGIMYAPAAFLGHVKGPLRLLGPISEAATISNIGEILTSEIGVGKVIPDKLMNIFREVAPEVCESDAIRYGVCENLLFATFGFDLEQTYSNSRLQVALSQSPDTTSVMNLIHFGQVIGSKRFARFDYGVALNSMKYGELTLSPPDFDLSLVTAPVALYNGRNDFISRKKDVNRLRRILPNIVEDFTVQFKYWNHVDFLIVKLLDFY